MEKLEDVKEGKLVKAWDFLLSLFVIWNHGQWKGKTGFARIM